MYLRRRKYARGGKKYRRTNFLMQMIEHGFVVIWSGGILIKKIQHNFYRLEEIIGNNEKKTRDSLHSLPQS